jgi:hypothetical protein
MHYYCIVKSSPNRAAAVRELQTLAGYVCMLVSVRCKGHCVPKRFLRIFFVLGHWWICKVTGCPLSYSKYLNYASFETRLVLMNGQPVYPLGSEHASNAPFIPSHRLLNDAPSGSVSNGSTFANDKLQRTWKGAVVAHLKTDPGY